MASRKQKAEESRARIFQTAVELFRERGFDGTTMRDIAKTAGMSLGSTYHYFDSKQSIVLAYYRSHQDQLSAATQAYLESATDPIAAVGHILHTKLSQLEGDQGMLVGLLPHLVNPADPLSTFSSETLAVREQAISLFRRALELDEAIPERDTLALLLWTLHLGILLYFVSDESDGHTKTHGLVDQAMTMLTPLVPMLGTPLFSGYVAQLTSVLKDAGLSVSPPATIGGTSP